MKKKILIILASYYKEVSVNLLKNTKNFLRTKSIDNFKEVKVPGVFEIPVIISRNIKKYDGFIALGCVIKGETPHFDFISSAATNGIMKLSIENKKPIGNGIITCLNKKQAIVRSKTKGQEAASAVVHILNSH
tara:strand:- start:1053 stop:1451 length:399 start_codon:yes stop_codon:yes gene_type:complete